MSEQEDVLNKQQYPPEFIARVKEEHSQQTPLTAETLMVMAYKMASRAQELQEVCGKLERMVDRLGDPRLPEEARRGALVVAVNGLATLANSSAVILAGQASLTTEVARMKLKEIEVV